MAGSGGRRGSASEARSQDVRRMECVTHTLQDWRRLGREPVGDQALASGLDEEESGSLADDSHGVRGGIVGGPGLSEKPDILSE